MFSRVNEARAASGLVNLSVSETLRPQCPCVNFRSRIWHETKILEDVRSSIVFAFFWPPSFFQQISIPVPPPVVTPFAPILPANHSTATHRGLTRPARLPTNLPC